MKTGVQPYSLWHLAISREEHRDGPHHHMLLSSGVPGQRPNRPGQHPPPRTHGHAVPGYRVPQNVQCHTRHRVLPPAHGGRDRPLRGHVARLRLAPPAIVAAFGCDERTVTWWMARGGVHGQAVPEHLVAPPRALGQVHAVAIRGTQQGGIGWMAGAMLGSPRLGLAGAVSEPRDLR